MKEIYETNPQEILTTSCDFDIDGLRHDYSVEEVIQLFAMPFNDLIFKAADIHRLFHDPNKVQICTLLSFITGSCPENC